MIMAQGKGITAGGASVSMELRGVRELSRALRAAGGDLDDLKTTNRQAADVVTPVAARLAPKRTGRLAATIRAGATRRAGVVRAGKKAVPYAGVINYGWPTRNIRARLFMNRAAKQTEPQWTQIYNQAVQKIIDDIISATNAAS